SWCEPGPRGARARGCWVRLRRTGRDRFFFPRANVARVRYVHVDVFSREPYTGNGLAVFPEADGLTGEQSLEIPREMGQFESVFPLTAGREGVAARIFTEDEELDFAGHPVLGAAAVLHSQDSAETAVVELLLNAGPVSVETRRHGDSYEA